MCMPPDNRKINMRLRDSYPNFEQVYVTRGYKFL